MSQNEPASSQKIFSVEDSLEPLKLGLFPSSDDSWTAWASKRSSMMPVNEAISLKACWVGL